MDNVCLILRLNIIGLLWFILTTNLHANENKTLAVLSANTPVFSQFQDDGTVKGYSVDFARAVLREAGYHAESTPMQFSLIMKEMESGEQIVATGIGRTENREDQFYWITPLTANVIGLFGKTPFDLDELSKSNKKISVSVMRGDYRAELGNTYSQFIMVEYDNWAQAIQAALQGRVDAVFFSGFGLALFCERAKLECSSLTRQLTHNVLYSYMAMPKTEQNRELANTFIEAAKRFVESSEFDKLVMRWLPSLKRMSSDVDEVEGVITLGKIGRDEQVHDNLWVITNPEPLFSERDERGRLTGYAVELIRHILNEANIKTDILTAPWQRIFVESTMKPDVLVFSLARTPERENQYHWITPITQNAYSVFGLNSNNTEASSFSELPSRSRIAVLKGDFRQAVIESGGHIAVTSDTWSSALESLLNGNVDYLFLSDGGINIICDRIDNACEGVKKLFVYQKATTYLAMSKQGTDKALVEKLKASAQTFKQSKEFDQLIGQWLGVYADKTTLNMYEDDGILVLGKLD